MKKPREFWIVEHVSLSFNAKLRRTYSDPVRALKYKKELLKIDRRYKPEIIHVCEVLKRKRAKKK